MPERADSQQRPVGRRSRLVSFRSGTPRTPRAQQHRTASPARRAEEHAWPSGGAVQPAVAHPGAGATATAPGRVHAHRRATEPAVVSGPSPFGERPRLVFWEMTRACRLACGHCRAAAEPMPRPGELTTAEGERLIEDLRRFGEPLPLLVATGGDPLMRPDLFHLLEGARQLGFTTALAPAVTRLLNGRAIERLAACGVHGMSVSLDAPGWAHDELRGVPGTFRRSLLALRRGRSAGLAVQVNTVVMRRTLWYLPALAARLIEEGVRIWEVFFLVATGRAMAEQYITPEEAEDVCRFLLDVTGYGIAVRTVEAPFIRRVQAQRWSAVSSPGPTYSGLMERLRSAAGEAGPPRPLPPRGTLDGDGVLFIAHDGRLHPGGLLPVLLGDARQESPVSVYRNHPLLQAIRQRRFNGPCGRCAWRWACGGSRARSYAERADALGSDPACRQALA
jgi:radical SAM protein